MQLSQDTKYTRYKTGHCNYILLLNSNIVWAILVVGISVAINLLLHHGKEAPAVELDAVFSPAF